MGSMGIISCVYTHIHSQTHHHIRLSSSRSWWWPHGQHNPTQSSPVRAHYGLAQPNPGAAPPCPALVCFRGYLTVGGVKESTFGRCLTLGCIRKGHFWNVLNPRVHQTVHFWKVLNPRSPLWKVLKPRMLLSHFLHIHESTPKPEILRNQHKI